MNALARAGGFLALEPGRTTWGSRDWSTPLRELAAASPGDLLRVAFAVAAGCVEETISSYGGYGGRVSEYLAALAKLGYVLDGYEEAELARTIDDEQETETGDRGDVEDPASPDEDGTDAA